MESSLYLPGVFMAISSGVLNILGNMLNKKVVNDVNRTSQEKLFRKLIRNPVWLAGLLLQLGASPVLLILAIAWIGPALTPGLMALGLIVLALGAVRITGEKLVKSEMIGILLMIVAIFFLGLSNLSIDVPGFDYTESGFLSRTSIFTAILFIFSIAFKLISRNNKRFRGILLALVSGLMLSLSNFWISVLEGTIIQVFGGQANTLQWFLFISSAGILVVTNFYAVFVLQEAFKSGQASNLLPVQQVPIQITPIFVYFTVFAAYLFNPINTLSPVWMLLGIGIIIVSSFLLGKRQAKIESIKWASFTNE